MMADLGRTMAPKNGGGSFWNPSILLHPPLAMSLRLAWGREELLEAL